jgi:hypothetical protein
MRKVLSFVLVLSLVLGSFGMAFAAPLSDIAGEDFEDAVNVLTELGVIKGYPDGTYKPDNIVTRAEMAVIVVSALGLADYATGTAKFSDMAGHWSNPYVAYATSLGVISGYPDGTFKPDKTVSYDEAATMLVAALGYNADSLVGTWPANFVTKAKTLGILDGIKAGAAGANRGDIAIMAYQTLDQNIGKTDKDGVWDPTVLKDDGVTKEFDNMLSRLGAEVYAPGAGAYGPSADQNDFIVLGTEDSVVNLKPYVGALVTAYANGDGEIIAIKEVKSTFLTGTLAAYPNTAGVTTFESDDVEYDVAKLTAAQHAALQDFKNGKPGTIVFDADTEYQLAVKVSGVKITEVYSVSEWTVSASDQVSKSQLDAIEKNDKLLGQSFDLDNNNEIDLDSFELVGVDSLSDIDVDDVVYVYTNGTITKIEVSNEVVTGEVTKIRDGKYTIDGKAYSISKVTGAPQPSAPKIGDEIEAYIGPDGKIYDYDKVAGTADKIGVILATGDVEGTGLNETDAKVKLFLADGTNKTFVVDPDAYEVAITGLLDTDGKWTGNLAGTAVKYEINKDGDISALAKVTFDGSDKSVKLFKNGTFDGFKVDADATIITYTDTGAAGLPYSAKAADYSVTTLDKVLGSSLENAYYTLNDSSKIDFLYINSTSTGTDGIYGVVVATEENNSDAGYGIDMLVDGAEQFYNSANYTAFGETEFKKLYEVKLDASGDATLEDKSDALGVVTITKANNPTVSGYVVSYAAGTTVKKTLDDDVVVYVWNDTEKVYEIGSISDIEDVVANVYLYDTDSTADNIYDIVLVQ